MMIETKVQRLMQAGVAMATTIAIVMAVNVIGIGIAYWFDDKLGAGDILSFEGALLGAGGAVIGAIFLEERKRRQQIVEEQRPILDALSTLSASLQEQAAKARLGDLDPSDVSEGLAILRGILSFFPPKNPALMGKRKRAEEAVTAYLGGVNFALKYEGEQYPDHAMPQEVQRRLDMARLEVKRLIDAYMEVRA